MSVPIPLPDPARGDQAAAAQRLYGGGAAIVSSLAVVAGTALLGVAAGFCWAAVAPRAWMVIYSPGADGLINAETSAYISADVAFCLICLGGGVLSGVLGYVFAVRRHGPLGMAGVIAGALAAAFMARWIGEQSGQATYQHLLATLPVGGQLREPLMLGASGALGFWVLAACVAAGGLELLNRPRRRQAARHRTSGGMAAVENE